MADFDDLEKYFQEGAGQFNRPPSDAVWEGLAAKLPAVMPWYVRWGFTQWALASVATLFVVYVVFMQWRFEQKVDNLEQQVIEYQESEQQWQLRWDTVYQELKGLRQVHEQEPIRNDILSVPEEKEDGVEATLASETTLASVGGVAVEPLQRTRSETPTLAKVHSRAGGIDDAPLSTEAIA